MAFLLAGGQHAAQATDRGTTASGMAYVSGRVGETELTLLDAEKDRHSYWLVTAAKRSGAYVAGVRVRIIDASSRTLVLEHTMDGPWLFCTLPVGRYEVQASYPELKAGLKQTRMNTTTIHPGDHHQMIFYFDVPDETGPDGAGAIKGNPETASSNLAAISGACSAWDRRCPRFSIYGAKRSRNQP